MAKPPETEQDPGRKGRRLEIEVFDQSESDVRCENHERQAKGYALAARDATREKEQREAGQDCTGAASQRDARRHDAVQHLASRLVLDQQRPDNVEDGADDQQPGEEPPYFPALCAQLVAHESTVLAKLTPR